MDRKLPRLSSCAFTQALLQYEHLQLSERIHVNKQLQRVPILQTFSGVK